EDLRQVAAHLAGLLVLVVSGANGAAAEHPTVEKMRRLCDEAADAVRRARPSARARRHHEELLAACSALELALAAARRSLGRSGSPEIDPILVPLRAGYMRLQRAAAALPGFELVAFDHGCCRWASRGSACGPREESESSSAAARASGGGVPASKGK